MSILKFAPGPVFLPKLLVPIAGGTYNAFNPSGGFLNATVLVLSASDFNPITINGIQNSGTIGGPGRLLWIVCTGAVGGGGGTIVTFNHDSSFAAATNRMWLKANSVVVQGTGGSIGFIYDDDIGIWVQIAAGGA
jgi:hypothetical protein